MTEFPEEVTERLALQDSLIEDLTQDWRRHQAMTAEVHAALSHAQEIRAAIIETADACLRAADPSPSEITDQLDTPPDRQPQRRRRRTKVEMEAARASADSPPKDAGEDAAPPTHSPAPPQHPDGTFPTASGGVERLDVCDAVSVPGSHVGPLIEPAAAPTLEHVLDFITRAGDMGVSPMQLKVIGATDAIMGDLTVDGWVMRGDDGRWRAISAGESGE